MFYSTTFAPAFERERRYKMMKQTFRKIIFTSLYRQEGYKRYLQKKF